MAEPPSTAGNTGNKSHQRRRRRNPRDPAALSTVAAEIDRMMARQGASDSKPDSAKVAPRHRRPRGPRNNPAPQMSDADQRQVSMHSELRYGYECMICMSEIKFYQAIWTCRTCFKLFHLKCAHEVCTRMYFDQINSVDQAKRTEEYESKSTVRMAMSGLPVCLHRT
jgi:transcriptional repressor NF-X1